MKGDHLGEFEELVLLAVHGLRNQAYGVTVQHLLERESSRPVSLGPVYAVLERLQQKGFLESQIVVGTPTRGGRSRRVFTLTPEGIASLCARRETRERLYDIAQLPAVGTRP